LIFELANIEPLLSDEMPFMPRSDRKHRPPLHWLAAGGESGFEAGFGRLLFDAGDGFGVDGAEPGVDETEAKNRTKGDGVEESRGDGIHADYKGRGNEIFRPGAAKKAHVLGVIEGGIQDRGAVEPTAAGDAAERNDKKHERRGKKREQGDGEPEQLDEDSVTGAHPESGGQDEGEDGEGEFDRAFVGESAEPIPAPVGQLEAAAGAGTAKDFIGEPKREPEGKDIEAENPREDLPNPEGRVAGEIGGGQRDQERIDQEKAAEKNFGEPVGIGKNLAEALLLIEKAWSGKNSHEF
jgi:hypothetical protein